MLRLYLLGWRQSDIAEAAGRSPSTVRYYLRKLRARRRPPGPRPLSIVLTPLFLEQLDGALLGGASLLLQRHARTPYIVFNVGLTREDALLAFQAVLTDQGILWRRAQLKSGIQLATRSYVELRPHWRRWYSKSVKLVVPKDVRLTPLALRTWYAFAATETPTYTTLRAKFAPASVNRLASELQRLYGWRARPGHHQVVLSWHADREALRYRLSQA